MKVFSGTHLREPRREAREAWPRFRETRCRRPILGHRGMRSTAGFVRSRSASRKALFVREPTSSPDVIAAMALHVALHRRFVLARFRAKQALTRGAQRCAALAAAPYQRIGH